MTNKSKSPRTPATYYTFDECLTFIYSGSSLLWSEGSVLIQPQGPLLGLLLGTSHKLPVNSSLLFGLNYKLGVGKQGSNISAVLRARSPSRSSTCY